MQIKLISTRKVVYLASFWKWGFLELGSGLFVTLRLRGRLGRDGCPSALWDCSGRRIYGHVGMRPPKQSHNALWQTSRPSLPRNLKVANGGLIAVRLVQRASYGHFIKKRMLALGKPVWQGKTRLTSPDIRAPFLFLIQEHNRRFCPQGDAPYTGVFFDGLLDCSCGYLPCRFSRKIEMFWSLNCGLLSLWMVMTLRTQVCCEIKYKRRYRASLVM